MRFSHHLATLEASGLIRLAQAEPELEYLFRHALVQEAAYESLLKADRRVLHRAVAETLEQLYPEQLPDWAVVLGRHFREAGEVDRACEYFIQAGNVARQQYANPEALAAYTDALALAAQPAAQIDIHLSRGAVLETVGRWVEAEDSYRTALALGRELSLVNRVADSQEHLGVLARERGDYSAALDWLTQARAIYEQLGEASQSGRLTTEIGGVFYRQGDFAAARREVEAGLRLSQELNHQFNMAEAFSYLGAIAYSQGDYAEARHCYEESLALQRALGNKLRTAAILSNLGLVAQESGDYRAARELFETSLALEREIGHTAGIASSLINLGLLAHTQQEYATAHDRYAEALSLARQMGDKWNVANILENWGNTAIEQHDYRRARAAYVESLVLAHAAGNRPYVAYNLNGLAAVALGGGQACRAAQLAAAAEKLRAALNLAWERGEQRIYERTRNAFRAELSESEFSAAWAAGEQMTLEEAVAYALNADAEGKPRP